MKSLKIFTDGGARGNPGPAGIGVAVYNEKDETLERFCRFLRNTTNNVAEYEALIAGLELARKHNAGFVEFFLDSELVVQQMRGVYKVKNENLSKYFETARGLAKGFKRISFTHIPREKNTVADMLVNEAIDTKKTDSGGSSTPLSSRNKTGQIELFQDLSENVFSAEIAKFIDFDKKTHS